ncbi:MAG: hypothetical protein K5923_03265 [Clostridia bacterium]|nr:hypothetical protein [Clostridia bacterium]
MLKEREVLDVDKHIKEIENVIQLNDQIMARALYDELLKCYSKCIPCFEFGTNALFVKTNMQWNFNDGVDLVDEDDYINDLKIILKKVQKYYDDLSC